MKTIICTLFCGLIAVTSSAQKICKAVEKRDLPKVQKYIDKGEDVNEYNRKGLFPLWLASANNDVAIAQLLFDYGADIDQKTKIAPYHSTSLDYPCQEGYLEIVKLLVIEGADINAEGYLGMTPLLLASSNGRYDVVKFLIEKGADIDHQDIDGNFPLGEAARQGHLHVVKLLLNKGADLQLRNLYKKNAYDIALANGHMQVEQFLRSL